MRIDGCCAMIGMIKSFYMHLYALDFYNSGPNKSKLHFVINKEGV